MNQARLRTLVALCLLIGLAFALRSLGSEHVLREDGTRFWEFDPYYHVWRVFQTLNGWPHVPVFDTSMNTPKGATVIWPPLYDFGIALVARLLGHAAGDVRGVERVAAHVPAILGALTVVPLLFLARRLLGRGAWPWLACALFVATPIHMWYSRLGFVDHHVAVTLAQVLMLLAFLRALDTPAPAPGRGRQLARLAAATAALTAGFLIWNGFLFFVFLLDAGLLAVMLVERARADSPVWKLMAATHALGALLLVPFVRDVVAASGRPFSPLTLSWLSVAALAGAAFVALLEGLRRSSFVAGLSGGTRRLALGAPLLVVAVAALANLPRLGQGFEWLLASDRFMASVVESGSSLVTNNVFDVSHPYGWLSGFFFAMPLALFLLGRELRNGGWAERGRLLLLVAGALLVAMAVLQRRFAEPLAPLQAILAADLLRRLHARLSRHGGVAAGGEAGRTRQERRREKRKAAEQPLAPASAPVLVPAVAVGLCVLSAYAGGPAAYRGALDADSRYNGETHADLQRFAQWLDRKSGPTPAGVARPEGALSLWDLGHRILYVTHLPVVANNFGLHIGLDSWHDAAAFFMEHDEAKAVAALAARRVRYVVSDYDLATSQLLVGYVEGRPDEFFETVKDAAGSGTLMKPAFTRTLYFRLGSSHMGSEGVSRYPDGRELPIEPLEHFRLLFETEQRDAIRALRIFERVAGARLQVRGVPAEGLRLSYTWRTPAGREHRYRRMLSAAGQAALPYSSELSELGQSAEYRLEGRDGGWLTLRVPEADVQAGNALALDWSQAQPPAPQAVRP